MKNVSFGKKYLPPPVFYLHAALRNTEGGTNEVQQISKEESGDSDDRLARRFASLHRAHAGNEEALHRARYCHHRDFQRASRITLYRVSADSPEHANTRYP